MNEPKFVLNIAYGHWESDARMVQDGPFAVAFESRKRLISREGVAGPWSEWSRTGARLVAPPEAGPAKPWWKFW